MTVGYLELLGGLAWGDFPEPPLRHWDTRWPERRAAFVAAYLVKVEEGKKSMPDLRKFLVNHPALVWSLGFHLHADPSQLWGFDADRSLATHRHFSRVLRELPNDSLQFLLKGSVQVLDRTLPADCHFADEISLDTKHILAWVKENNPRCFVEERFDKTRQPKGDPAPRGHPKLGCKKKSNAHATTSASCKAADSSRHKRHPLFSGCLDVLGNDRDRPRASFVDGSDQVFPDQSQEQQLDTGK